MTLYLYQWLPSRTALWVLVTRRKVSWLNPDCHASWRCWDYQFLCQFLCSLYTRMPYLPMSHSHTLSKSQDISAPVNTRQMPPSNAPCRKVHSVCIQQYSMYWASKSPFSLTSSLSTLCHQGSVTVSSLPCPRFHAMSSSIYRFQTCMLFTWNTRIYHWNDSGIASHVTPSFVSRPFSTSVCNSVFAKFNKVRICHILSNAQTANV